MGLFNFIKDAGEKLFHNASNNDDQSKTLQEHIQKLGLPGSEKAQISVKDGKATVSGEGLSQEVKEKILIAAGNVAGINEVEDNVTVAQNEPEAKFYTVKAGDTLSSISQQVYGTASQYNKIFEANKPMLSHPDKIYPGQTLRIPQ